MGHPWLHPHVSTAEGQSWECHPLALPGETQAPIFLPPQIHACNILRGSGTEGRPWAAISAIVGLSTALGWVGFHCPKRKHPRGSLALLLHSNLPECAHDTWEGTPMAGAAAGSSVHLSCSHRPHSSAFSPLLLVPISLLPPSLLLFPFPFSSLPLLLHFPADSQAFRPQDAAAFAPSHLPLTVTGSRPVPQQHHEG